MSCFGSNDQSDDGDVWRVSWDKALGSAWLQDAKVQCSCPPSCLGKPGAAWLTDSTCLQVQLQQIQTGVWLASSTQKFQRPISGQHEIFGRSKPDNWVATQGVYFPDRSQA